MSSHQTDDQLAQILWDYMLMGHDPRPSDAIVCLCSYDLRVANRAAELWHSGLAPIIVFSGKGNSLTEKLFTKSEAETFADRAIELGVPKGAIILEKESTNTGQNISFTHAKLSELGIDVSSLILVQKPYMERRTYATFMKQWPSKQITIYITSPRLTYQEYAAGHHNKTALINHLVGDVQRVKVYPSLKGYQIPQNMPDQVWRAYETLVERGFTQHLITD